MADGRMLPELNAGVVILMNAAPESLMNKLAETIVERLCAEAS